MFPLCDKFYYNHNKQRQQLLLYCQTLQIGSRKYLGLWVQNDQSQVWADRFLSNDIRFLLLLYYFAWILISVIGCMHLCCDVLMLSISALFGGLTLPLLTVLKVREEQEKRRLEEEQQSQLLPAQQPGQQSCTEAPPSQPVPQSASYVSPQPNQHSTQMSAQPASQQSLQSSNYSTPQSTQLTSMAPYVPHSTGQVPVSVQGQSVATIQPESEEPEADQHQQLQHTGGGVY